MDLSVSGQISPSVFAYKTNLLKSSQKEEDEILQKAEKQITERWLKSVERPAILDSEEEKLPPYPDPFNELPPIPPVPPVEPRYSIPGLFNKKRVQEENELLRRQYLNALDIYNNNLQIYQSYLKNYQERKEAARTAEREYNEKVQAILQRDEIRKAEMEAAEKDYRKRISDAKRSARKEFEEYKLSHQVNEQNDLSVVVPEMVEAEFIAGEISKAVSTLKELLQAKYLFYSLDIIHSKYRDPVALAKFYDYLTTGRCDRLEGADGAYNLFESEKRSDLMLSKLDDVLDSLEEIKQNQLIIYQQLVGIKKELVTLNRKTDQLIRAVDSLGTQMSDIGDQLGDIGNSVSSLDSKADTMVGYMKKLEKNSAVIAYNTAATAYYSRVNSELTNALGYMIALK